MHEFLFLGYATSMTFAVLVMTFLMIKLFAHR